MKKFLLISLIPFISFAKPADKVKTEKSKETSVVAELKGKVAVKDVENSKGILIVDCYASWCGPCKQMAPVFESVAKGNKNHSFKKVNSDEAQEFCAKFGVNSLPTFLIFKDGKKIGFFTGGGKDKKTFEKELKSIIDGYEKDLKSLTKEELNEKLVKAVSQ